MEGRHMNDDSVDTVIRQAIGGDPGATSWILAQADTTESPVVIAMAALLERRPGSLDRALAAASTSRDRQVVEIARAHLNGNNDLVDALARDHLVDFPDSLIVAWIASDALERSVAKARFDGAVGCCSALGVGFGAGRGQTRGQLISVPAGKTSELLVRLALDAGTSVRTDRLVEDLWGDDSVRTSRNTVQSKIAKLRHALGDPAVVVGGDGGYTLVVDPLDVDAVAVLTRAAEATALLGDGESWRGRAVRDDLADVPR